MTTQAQEFLDQVKNATGESCSLAVLDEDEVVYVARSAARKVIDLTLGVGSRLPAYCSSLGRVLLADFQDDEIIRRLDEMDRIQRTEYTKTGVTDILEAIREARFNGYCLVEQELEIGLRSISVPVRNQNQRIIAAMTVGMPAIQSIQQSMLHDILPALQNASRELGSQLIC